MATLLSLFVLLHVVLAGNVRGQVITWGANDYNLTTVPAAAQSGVSAIAAGSGHTLALKNDGVIAWGANHAGQTTVPVAAQFGVTAIAAGGIHTVALKSDGRVIAWGGNDYNQTTVPAAAQSGVTAIAAGNRHTVALKSDGSVITWGANDYNLTTVPAAAQSGVTAIAAGDYHTVALKSDGSVIAWGYNADGQTTVPAAAQSGVTAIAAGYDHTVALKSDGSVIAWGSNSSGQTTVPAAAQSGVTAIAAGYDHTVALKSDGSVIAWGDNSSGQTTVPAAAQSGMTAIAAGYRRTVAFRAAFELTLPPVTLSVSSGAVGAQVILTGTGLDSTTAVTLNGIGVDFTIDSPTQLTITVPAGANTGRLIVTTPNGSATNAGSFTVIHPAPTITSFTPNAEMSGSGVVITGTELDTTTAVHFNGTSAAFEVVSATELHATVPPLASTGPISVTNPGGIATSTASFTVSNDTFLPPYFGKVRNKQILVSPSGMLVYHDNGNFRRLDDAGALDPTFAPPANCQPILVQADGKIIARQYTLFGEGFSVVRLDANGALDLTYQASETGGRPEDVPVCGITLPDGRAIVSNGYRAVWLNSNGTVGATFNTGTIFPGGFGFGAITSMARQADGGILVAMEGHLLFQEDKSFLLIRLKEDGTRDMAFGTNGSVTANDAIHDVICQPDGRILMAGQFSNIAPFFSRKGLARLESNGVVDANFNPGLGSPKTILPDEGFSVSRDHTPEHFDFLNAIIDSNGHAVTAYYEPAPYVLRMALQTDGKIVIFGQFASVDSRTRRNMARLNPDGTRDDSFLTGIDHAAGADYYPGYEQYRYKWDYVGAEWFQFNYIRTWPDGPYWKYFDAGLAIQPNGKILVGGEFGNSNLKRINSAPAIGSLVFVNANTARWSRSGAGPDLLGVTFDQSLDGGVTWVRVGNASRIGTSADWEMSDPHLGVGLVRARGLTQRGGLIEQMQTTGPLIMGISQAGSGVGASVTITGFNFGPGMTVKFNGTDATFFIDSRKQITATVPFGATTGPVTVSSPDGTATSTSNVTVSYPATTITSFTPSGGSLGSYVTLIGTGLDSVTAVSFNGTNALLANLTSTSVTAYVPEGASTGPITVTSLGGTATTSTNFTVNSGSSGFWSTRAWTGDSTTGIPAANSDANGHLVVALRFGFNINTTVNGRLVEGLLGGQGSSYVRTSPSVWETYASTTNSLTAQGGAGSAVMASSFVYGNDASSIILQGLDPEQRYRVSFFSVAFEDPGTRLVNFSSGSDQIVVDQDQFGLGNGIRVDYHFTAASPSQAINLNALNTGGGRTWHNYAITLVRVVPQQPTLTTLTATNVTANSAVLNGTVTANGSPTTARFYYGSPSWNGSNIMPSPASLTTEWGNTAFSATLTGLKAHTQYEYIAFGSNAAGANYGGSAASFFTPNTVPLADHTSASTQEDTAVFFPLPVSDADGDNLTVTLVSLPAGKVAIFPFAPYVDYTPAPNYVGPDSFSYRVTDGFGGTSVTRAVNITVTAVNDLPTLSSIPNATINEDAGTQTVSLAGINSGAANESQTLTVTATSNNPALIPNPTVTYVSPSTTGTLSYTPVAGANGAAVITVTVSEGVAVTSQSFMVRVNPVNTAPSFALPSGGPVGVTWTARDNNRSWTSIASSADGTKLAATADGNSTYTSSDSGATWVLQENGPIGCESIASSADGTKLAAVVYGGQIHTSTNSGVTWTARESSRYWKSIASSADGTKLVAVVYGGQIHTSTNSGVTWTARESSRNWQCIASSADGTKLAALDGRIWTSTDSGVNWSLKNSDFSNFTSIASSADGTKLAATLPYIGPTSGDILTSNDSGATWTSRYVSGAWRSIASSADGTRLAAAEYGGKIYTSLNSGETWTERIYGNWSSIASSADGKKLAAVSYNGQIYTSVPVPYALSVAANSGANTTANFATNIAPGAADEAGQVVSFNLSNTNNPLFSVQPAIASNGTLTFTPDPSARGTATVTVTAQDNGGEAFGGVDTSAPQTFTITVTGPPVVTTPTVTNITATGATLGGNVTGDGGSAVSARGIVYALTSVNANPTLGGTGVNPLTAAGTTGVFTVSVTGLSQDSSYSFRAYATNSLGVNYTSAVTFTPSPPPGSIDPLDASVVGSNVRATAVQPDGKIILAGGFTSVLGVARNNLARLNADGTLDASFNPNADNIINSVAVQADGKILLGGFFTTVGGITRNRIARLNADGTLDTGFNPNASSTVWCVVVQADEKILLGGSFTTVSGTARNRIARFNADGTLDAGFNPNASSVVSSVAVQADGKVLLGGPFTTVGGVARNYLARVNADGTLDADFNPNAANGPVNRVAVQADGKILLVGSFNTVGGVARNYLARVNADGTLDAGFDPNPNNSVHSLVVQADGKILLVGGFNTVGGITRNRIARLNADGTVDAGFNADVVGSVYSVAVQADGKILLGGDFTAVGGATRNKFARLLNDPATQTLTTPSNAQALWSRSGAGPELTHVAFDQSTDGGTTYTALATGTRVGTSANWQLTGLALSGNGLLRARGWTTGGYYDSSGLIEQVTAFSFAVPEIDVQQPALTSIPSGGSKDFGPVEVNTTSDLTFTIANTGNAALNLTGTPLVAVSGSGDFTVTAQPETPVVAAIGTMAFTVRFAPTTTGTKTATLTILNNDGNEGTYTITLNGTSLAPPPTLADINPATGSTVGGTAVTITGTNFTGATGVTFGGTAVASFTVVNATSITATTPAHAAGAASVLVTTPGGTNAANTLYTYIAPPAITGISPASGSTSGGRSVTITGTGFTGTTGVTFGGTNATSFTVDSATQITATTPSHPAGAVSVEVTTASGTNAANSLFTYVVPPTVTRDAISVVVDEGGTALNSGSFSNAATVTASVGTVTQATTWTHEGTMAQGAGSGPIELALDSAENLYVAAEAVNKIFKYDSSGALLKSWAVAGAPCGVAVDSANGWVYATSKNGNRVDKFTLDGDFLLSWGSTGTGNSQFNNPHCVAVDAAGAVYVSDSTNNTIKVFTSAGVYLRRWGTGGSGNGQFSFNQGIRITPGGVVYVADRNNHRIQYFDTNGTFLGKFGTFGSGNGQFSNPAGVGIDPGGNVTVGDLNNHRIQRFSAVGAYIDKLGQATGTPAGNLVFPHGTAFPPSGRSVYVADWANGRVVKFGTPGGWNWTHPTTDGPSQNQTVTITATDADGISATTTFSLAVENMAPTVAISAPASASEDASVNFAFTATDPSSMDQAAGFSWSLNYGDGTGVQMVSAGTASPLARTHTFVNPGTYTVTATATDKDGGVSGNATAVVTILPAAPTVTSISPATGSTAGGTNVTITGTNFGGTPSVTIGGAVATSVVRVDATTITATTPAHAAGAASVLVTTPGGTNAANTLYTFVVPNSAPTDISLSASSLAENNAANATVGTLSATDADAGDTHTFAKVSGEGDTDNASFTIDGSALKLIPVADFETKSSYSIRVQADDGNGGTFAKAFTIAITDSNDVPAAIALTPASIAEINAPNATVGTLSATDGDVGATHTFTKVSGAGDTDNASFTIDGSSVKLIPVADFETKASYSIRVQADDGSGGVFAQALIITITDVTGEGTLKPLTLSLLPNSDAGTLTFSPALGKNLQAVVGRSYKVTTKAKLGWFFQSWGGKTAGTSLSTTFTFAEGDRVVANFTPTPFTDMVAGLYNGIVKGSTTATDTQGNAGFFTATLTKNTGAFTGKLLMDGTTAAIAGVFNNETKQFTSPALSNGFVTSLTLDIASSTMTGTITKMKRGNAISTLSLNAPKAYSKADLPAVGLTGAHNLAFTAPVAPATLLDDEYPHGSGYGVLNISATDASSKIAGVLADGTAFTAASVVCKTNIVPVYASFAGSIGAIVGTASLDSVPATTDVAGSALRWFRRANSGQYYPWGYDTGLTIDLLGAKQATSTQVSLGLSGTPTVEFSGGPFAVLVSQLLGTTTKGFSSADKATSLSFNIAGLMSGSHTPAGTTAKHLIKGIIVGKGGTAEAHGFILTPAPAHTNGTGLGGLVELNP